MGALRPCVGTMKLEQTTGIAWVVLAAIVGIAVFLPFIRDTGGHGTAIAVSANGKWVITLAAVLPAVFILLRIFARPRRELILSAKFREAPLRAVGLAASFAGFAGLLAYLWCRLAIPYLPGPEVVERGELVAVTGWHPAYRLCTKRAIVRRQDGVEIAICLEQGLFFKTLRRDADCLHPGDAVTVRVRTTWLGNSAFLDRTNCR